eukprot:gene95-701_t
MHGHNLLKRQIRCPRRNCRRQMILSPHDGTDGFRWRCNGRGCSGTKTVRVESFFAGSHLSLGVLLAFTYCWCVGKRLSTVMVVLLLAEHTVVEWFNYMLEECSHKLLTLDIKLGGPGGIVEIDESVMIKRKYNRGARRQQYQQWVFGIYDRETKVGYLQFVDHRDEATLFPIIQQYVIPGTTINSDGWATYQNLPRLGYQHDVVIHQLHFVNPVMGVHINGVEAYWARAKQKIKAVYGSRLGMLLSYLDESMWRERYGMHGVEDLDNMLQHIAEHYIL